MKCHVFYGSVCTMIYIQKDASTIMTLDDFAGEMKINIDDRLIMHTHSRTYHRLIYGGTIIAA